MLELPPNCAEGQADQGNAAEGQPRRYHDAARFSVCTSRFPRPGKWWRFSFSLNGKQQLMSLGVYPGGSLKEARPAAPEARQLVAAGREPTRETAGARMPAACHSAREAAGEWLAGQEGFLQIFPMRHACKSSQVPERPALAIHRCLPLPDGRFPVLVNSVRHSWHFLVIPYELEYFCKSIRIIKFLPG